MRFYFGLLSSIREPTWCVSQDPGIISARGFSLSAQGFYYLKWNFVGLWHSTIYELQLPVDVKEFNFVLVSEYKCTLILNISKERENPACLCRFEATGKIRFGNHIPHLFKTTWKYSATPHTHFQSSQKNKLKYDAIKTILLYTKTFVLLYT